MDGGDAQQDAGAGFVPDTHEVDPDGFHETPMPASGRALDEHGAPAFGEIGQDTGEGRFLGGLFTHPALTGAGSSGLVGSGFGAPTLEPGGQRVAAEVGLDALATRTAAAVRVAALVAHVGDRSCGARRYGPERFPAPASRHTLWWNEMQDTTVKISVPGNHLMPGLLGERDVHLRAIENAFPGVMLHVRGNVITISGEGVDQVGALIEDLILLLEQGHPIDTASLGRSIDMIRDEERPSEVLTSEVLRAKGRTIRPKSAGQKRYIDAIGRNVITFGLGPAGTGKSWLAVAMAVKALQAKQVDRIILTRPAVEAGERLGFLPGDLMAKVDPYLRPLYDALHDMLDVEGVERLLERATVEVAPLAFMRGRTLNNAFIILDEAQNTTPEQMKMFLTRIGFGSRVVVTGDLTQVDVQGGRSGLGALEKVLGDIDGIEFVHLGSRDVVRHRIVQDIVDAYERSDRGADS
jgi:phosphate starvation-inducible PhoH-like protein